MILYSESRGRQSVNWNERLNAIVDTSKPNVDHLEINRWKNEAGSWVTCAVGNACDVIPRKGDGEPVDNRLRKLGIDFYQKMTRVYFASSEGVYERVVVAAYGARKVLTSIEERSSELISQINGE